MKTAAELKAEVLQYLRTANGVVIGQFGSYGADTDYDSAKKQLTDIEKLTGKSVGLTGMDYMMPEGRAEANRYIIDMWRRGLIVTVSWHAPNPWTGGKSVDTTGNNRLGDLLDATKPIATKWAQMLGEIADSLLELRAAGVPVLWRPFHEMNGGWFWWTPRHDRDDKPQPEAFKALWRHMHEYFDERGLDNLLWTFSPNACDQHRPLPLVYYPGEDVVDVVGMDKYRDLSENPVKLNAHGEYDQLVSTGKPVMLCEFGAIKVSGDGYNTPKVFDWEVFFKTLRADYPKIVAFQAWEYVWQIARKNYTGQAAMMTHADAITLDKLPLWGVPDVPPVDPPPVDPPGEPDPIAAIRVAVLEAIKALEAVAALLT